MADFITDFIFERQPRQWRRAWRALKSLMADKEKTDQVFVIMRSLSGNSQSRQFQRLIKTSSGREIIHGRLDLLTALEDRARLASLPDGSLEHYRITLNHLTVGWLLARKASYPPKCGSLSG